MVVLALLASVLFAATHAYTQAYDNRKAELGTEWFARGFADLQAGRSNAAVEEFRTALLYSPENWDYRLRLAEALAVSNRISEALGYYRSLWQSNPSEGAVNLELARLAVRSGDREGAERYFNGAIFGTWKKDAAANRREAVFEMIDFYLAHNDYGSADSQLVVLSSNLPQDSNLHVRVGMLFMGAADFVHAQEQFSDALLRDRDNVDALRGAAEAASRTGEYGNARSFLERLIRLSPTDNESRQRLETINDILELDPSQPRIGAAERTRRVVRGFELAGDRLNSCVAQLHLDLSTSDTGGLVDLLNKWTDLSPQIKQPVLVHDGDLADQTIELTYLIEKQTSKPCGVPPPGADLALLTLAQRRTGDAQ